MIGYNELAIVVLAAGNSSRMGSSKQMLKVNGQTLLEKTVVACLNSKIANITVALGSNSEIHRQGLTGKPVQVLVNTNWKSGIGNTLKFSLRSVLEKNINLQGMLFTVCDQPLISAEHINSLADLFLKESPVAVASHYKNTMGVPAIFDRNTFSQLLAINDNFGAKEVLIRLERGLKSVPFNGGEFDLDTPQDYQLFLNRNKND